jgi:ABC-2 type transport system permease protein
VIGALNLTGEFSHGTIRNTFAATPQRRKVLIAKAVVGWIATTIFASFVAVVGYVVGSTIFNSRGANLQFESNHYSALIGIVLLAGLLSLLGFGLGLLIRSSPATVVVFVLWPLLLEGLIALVLHVAGVDEPTKWLPYNAAIQMGDPTPEGDVGRWNGGLYMGAVVLAMIIIGIIVNERRDA